VVAGVVAVLVGGAVLGGCAGGSSGSPARGPAEIVDVADCAVRETLQAFGSGGGEDLPAAPRAGAVPDGFVPVAAVECRMAAVQVLPAPEPPRLLEPDEPLVPAPDVAPDGQVELLPDSAEDEPSNEPGGSGGSGGSSTSASSDGTSVTDEPSPTPPAGTPVDVVRLEGDLAPLLQQLRRPDVPAAPDQVCMAMFQVVPVLYLLDAGDRAVRVQWPTDACGFLLDGAAESVAALHQVDRTTLTLP